LAYWLEDSASAVAGIQVFESGGGVVAAKKRSCSHLLHARHLIQPDQPDQGNYCWLPTGGKLGLQTASKIPKAPPFCVPFFRRPRVDIAMRPLRKNKQK